MTNITTLCLCVYCRKNANAITQLRLPHFGRVTSFSLSPKCIYKYDKGAKLTKQLTVYNDLCFSNIVHMLYFITPTHPSSTPQLQKHIPTMILAVIVSLLLSISLLLGLRRRGKNKRKAITVAQDDLKLWDKYEDAEYIEKVGDLCDRLYEHDNNINHLVELEVNRMGQEQRKRSNLQPLSF